MAGPSLIATLGANITGFVRDLQTAKGHAKKEGEGIGSAFGDMVSSKLSGLAGAIGLEETIRKTIEYGSKVNDLALRLGISTDAVQQWDFALQQSGSSIDAAAGFFEKLAVNRDKALKGSDAQIEAFKKLGLTLDQLRTMRIEDIGASIAKALELGDPQALIGPLREVGGKGAGELVAAFKDGLAGALAEAPLISPEDIAALDRAGDAWAKLKAEFTATVAPVVAGITEGAMAVIDFARLALAVPIGALNGLIEAFSKFKDALSKGDIIGLLKEWSYGSIKDVVGGVGEAIDAVSKQQTERDKAAAAAAEARKKNSRTAFDTEGDSKGELDKKMREAEASLADKRADEANKVLRIHEQITEARRKSALAGMTDEEKKVELANQIAAKEKEIQQMKDLGGATELEIAEEEKSLSGLEGELAGAERKRERRPDFEVNSLQRIGGVIGTFSNVTQLAAVDYAQKSESHLAQIKKGIDRLVGLAGSGDDGVSF